MKIPLALITTLSLINPSPLIAAEEPAPPASAHAIELNLFGSDLSYRYRMGDHNFLVGLGLKQFEGPLSFEKTEGLLGYQTHIFWLPVEGLLLKQGMDRGHANIPGFGKVTVTQDAAYLALGSWFKPKIYGNFYLPISFGVQYPLSNRSELRSAAIADDRIQNEKKAELYIRFGGGYEF